MPCFFFLFDNKLVWGLASEAGIGGLGGAHSTGLAWLGRPESWLCLQPLHSPGLSVCICKMTFLALAPPPSPA